MKEAILHVDLDAILYNYRHLKCYYKKNVIAVLKDDAYHVGLIKVMEALKNEEGIIIAINHLNEAILLRENGYEKDILYLNVFDNEDIPLLIKYNISVIIDSLNQLKLIKNLAIPFHLKINTTMNRLGLNEKDALKAIKQLNDETNDNFKGVMTHFADDDINHEGYESFKKIASLIKKKDIIIHCFASSSLSEKFEDFTNYIRVGIKLYGIGERNSFLHNALTLTSPILTIKEIKKGQYVGYDHTFFTKDDGYLYILPIGYGQGYGRFNQTLAYIDNEYLKQAGKISMDYSSFFSRKRYSINQEVELFGKHVTIDALSYFNKIDPHEILVRLNLKKVYQQSKIDGLRTFTQ